MRSVTPGGRIGAVGTTYALAKTGLPMVKAPTGSMANNGAVTLGTALDLIYPNCYLYLPLNAIVAGSAAGFYFAQMSSTTVGTVFNNTYSGTDIPLVPAAPTAFATTGPGAFTGVITEQIALSVSLAAGILGPNGDIAIAFDVTNNNSAGAKTVRARFSGIGGTAHIASATTTITTSQQSGNIHNAGTTGSQISHFSSGSASPANITTQGTTDTTVATTLVFTLQTAVATDWVVVSGITAQLLT